VDDVAGKDDFTAEEWELLLEAPPAAGMIVIMADRGGLVRESYSLAKAYTEARKRSGQSVLIDEIVEAKPELDHTRYDSKEELREATLERLRDALALLDRKGSAEDVEQYRAFCWSVAEHVANASKEGFLGITGERVSDDERSALDDVRQALGIA
jgi:hypothetical protein